VGNDRIRGSRNRGSSQYSAKKFESPLELPTWNDPHTAAPLLWAFRHEDDMKFELSFAVADLDVQPFVRFGTLALQDLTETKLVGIPRILPNHTVPAKVVFVYENRDIPIAME
jgi:hypothetical protein